MATCDKGAAHSRSLHGRGPLTGAQNRSATDEPSDYALHRR